MKVKEIRELTTEQIEAKIVEAKDEILPSKRLSKKEATSNVDAKKD